MGLTLEFVTDPTRILTHKINTKDKLTSKLTKIHKNYPYAVVLNGENILAITPIKGEFLNLALAIAEKFWVDKGVLCGPFKESHAVRLKQFEEVANSFVKATMNANIEWWVLWWLLDDIEDQCIQLKEYSCFRDACNYAERKLIEQEYLKHALNHHQATASAEPTGTEHTEGNN